MSTDAQRSVVLPGGYVANTLEGGPADVQRVPVPATARALSFLSRVDYEEALVVEVGSAHDRTAEQWARAIFEDAPMAFRVGLRQGWFAFGYQLELSRSDRYVLGWEVSRNTSDFVLLAASSRVGMPAELLVQRRQQTLVFCVFVQHENFIARALWAGIEPVHRVTVRLVLEQFSRRLAGRTR